MFWFLWRVLRDQLKVKVTWSTNFIIINTVHCSLGYSMIRFIHNCKMCALLDGLVSLQYRFEWFQRIEGHWARQWLHNNASFTFRLQRGNRNWAVSNLDDRPLLWNVRLSSFPNRDLEIYDDACAVVDNTVKNTLFENWYSSLTFCLHAKLHFGTLRNSVVIKS